MKVFIGALHLALTVTQPAAVCIVKRCVDKVRRRDLHAEQLEKGIALVRGQSIVYAADAGIQFFEAIDPAARLIAVGRLRKGVAIEMFYFADVGDLRIRLIDARAFFAEIARKLFVEPADKIFMDVMDKRFRAGGIPAKGEKVLHILFERL